MDSDIVIMKRQAYSVLCTLLVLFLLPGCDDSGKTETGKEGSKKDVLAVLEASTLVNIAFGSGEKFVVQKPRELAICKQLITEERAAAYKCGYDGKLVFFDGDKILLEAEFNLGEKCRHIAYMFDGNFKTRIMDDAGIRFLEGLRQSSGPGFHATDMSSLRWMLGRWEQVESKGVVSFEEWEEVSDQEFIGRAFTLQGKDTVYREDLRLEVEKGKVYYIPTIPSNDGPVRFKMRTSGSKRATFENPAHDFPTVISYRLVEDTILHARISGVQNGKEGFKDFYMKRVK